MRTRRLHVRLAYVMRVGVLFACCVFSSRRGLAVHSAGEQAE